METRHSVVYHEPGVYAGWPANHGAWQWGDEMLFGFLRGPYRKQHTHSIDEPYEKMLARSLDGGETWTIEKPDHDFNCILPTPPGPHDNFKLTKEYDNIIRVCGVYDHGGDDCDPKGGYYMSHTLGMTWHGPYTFDEDLGMEPYEINTSRTCVLDNLVFMSARHADHWGTDYTFVVKRENNRFKPIGVVCSDHARAVMPSVATLDYTGHIFCALRRRQTNRRECWVDVVKSMDGGRTWGPPQFVGSTGANNGNPPALVAVAEDRLVCAYGNRDHGAIHGSTYSELTQRWIGFLIREAESKEIDIGYPQLFRRTDGAIVCVYYWSNLKHSEQHIACTIMEGV